MTMLSSLTNLFSPLHLLGSFNWNRCVQSTGLYLNVYFKKKMENHKTATCQQISASKSWVTVGDAEKHWECTWPCSVGCLCDEKCINEVIIMEFSLRRPHQYSVVAFNQNKESYFHNNQNKESYCHNFI